MCLHPNKQMILIELNTQCHDVVVNTNSWHAEDKQSFSGMACNGMMEDQGLGCQDIR